MIRSLFLCIFRAQNRAAADDNIAIVKHYRLSRSDGPLGFVENHTGKAIFHGINGCRLLCHTGTGLGLDTQGFSQSVNGDPVPIICNEVV